MPHTSSMSASRSHLGVCGWYQKAVATISIPLSMPCWPANQQNDQQVASKFQRNLALRQFAECWSLVSFSSNMNRLSRTTRHVRIVWFESWEVFQSLVPKEEHHHAPSWKSHSLKKTAYYWVTKAARIQQQQQQHGRRTKEETKPKTNFFHTDQWYKSRTFVVWFDLITYCTGLYVWVRLPSLAPNTNKNQHTYKL